MKCVCGYEHQQGIDDKGDWNEYLVGDEEFYLVEGCKFSINSSSYRYNERKVRLWACPKCFTVQMEKV